MSRKRRDRERAQIRAVIDIGSNTVRLVIYGAPPRVPVVLHNEKVTARLGRDIGETGAMPAKSMDQALAALERFRLLLDDRGVTDVQTVATAAVRDASNGSDFLKKVAAIGLEPRLLSGEEEARISANGVIGAFPGAHGVVADLGGGSLELISIEGDKSHHGVSLPFGTLRLPDLRAKGPDAFKRAVGQALKKADWATEHEGPLYCVGGTWRAFAAYAMRTARIPLTDPHGFSLPADEAMLLAKKVSRTAPDKLAAIPGIASTRAAALPDAAALLKIMLATLKPDGLVFSSWGLREGLLFDTLSDVEREKDPLIAGAIAFADPREGTITEAARIAAWTAPLANGNGKGSERLRLTAAMLALALARLEPNRRQDQAREWALDKRWVGVDPAGRAMLAAALLGSCGRKDYPDDLLSLASETELREALGWGIAIRLARRMDIGNASSALGSSVERGKKGIALTVTPERAPIAGEAVRKDLALLGSWFDCPTKLEISERMPG
ncbi:Ppx/GppA family phosphatase [Tsuneonella mangrovi]|uniref:Ppx/GppA family phosphatase n=1 Tax=Tsuneonella mangrovi TaxID=1982042 RepID=UPI001470EAC9|nr:Ppx/GppA family phosphatase [Tsuneonella mangrovi]